MCAQEKACCAALGANRCAEGASLVAERMLTFLLKADVLLRTMLSEDVRVGMRQLSTTNCLYSRDWQLSNHKSTCKR